MYPVQENNVMILSFWPHSSEQTVQTQVRLLLEEQSDQGLRCLPFHLHLLGALLCGEAAMFKFQGHCSKFLGVRVFRSFTVTTRMIQLYTRTFYNRVQSQFCVSKLSYIQRKYIVYIGKGASRPRWGSSMIYQKPCCNLPCYKEIEVCMIWLIAVTGFDGLLFHTILFVSCLEKLFSLFHSHS